MAVAGILAFVVALLVSVMIHEAGHFLTARRYGMKATQFFVGFGPTLWSTQRGETEYGVKAIPAGGFVKIIGMTPLEEVPPGDEDRAFYKQPAGKRTVVLAAGSFMHFVIALVLILISSFAVGRVVEGQPALAATSDCVAADAAAKCDSPGAVPGPAKAAGIQPDDVVVAIGGKKIKDSEEFVRTVRRSAGTPLTLTVERDGKTRDVMVTPAKVLRPSLEDEKVKEEVGAIGVSVQRRLATERVGPVAALKDSRESAGLIIKGIGTTLTDKLGTITKLYGDDRDPEGFIGVYGAGRISGEVLASQETAGVKLLTFLSIMAGLNVFVGVFNLLPLLPLDGGHIAVLLFEQARDRIKRLFGYRGALQRVDLTKLMPLTYAVVLAFVGLTVWILGADIVNPVRLPQ
ncbi:MAG: site-2 protease family protein [Actinobacteria bacterium]|nr:site-2 protease family protein [Actinomycetota bacterium]MCA1721470.1 site-2 protease family protein [Actinomycetota bacterium]